jgi:hypothetical protein
MKRNNFNNWGNLVFAETDFHPKNLAFWSVID